MSDICREDIAECVEDAFRYDRMVLAASSYDGGVFLPMNDFLTHLKAKAFQKRTVGIIENGSWAPTAAKTMKDLLAQMQKIEIIEPSVTIRTTMKEADVQELEKLADELIRLG